MVAYTKPQQRTKEESEKFTERNQNKLIDKIKFILVYSLIIYVP